jgi:hypothetical protein
MVHEKKEGLVLKLDYEKAFDKVDIDFLLDVLLKRGFCPKVLAWIKAITTKGSVGVKLNNAVGKKFVTGKGVRQGDPLSPLLFNLVVDVLTRMLIKASNANLIRGLFSNLCPGEIICLRYADDTILFSEKNPILASNLKVVLTCFEKVSRMRINYEKSELIPLGVSEEEVNSYIDILGCALGKFPIKYLGIPLHYSKLRREDIQPLIDKILKRIAGWRGKLLSYVARLTLIKACLASIPIYLFFKKFPSGPWILLIPRWPIVCGMILKDTGSSI